MLTVIDSHTGGEPTRLIIAGGPDLGDGPLAGQRQLFARDHDHIRRFALNEPRGFPAIVGALLTEPVTPGASFGLIFFNNAGMLGMCGHGTIGAVVTLAHLGRIGPGLHLIDTPVGPVTARLDGRHQVTIENVPSYVHLRDITISVPGIGRVTGDVAWGGNWFFLTDVCPAPLDLAHSPALISAAAAIRDALARAGITGRDGGEIDHIELFGPALPGADSRNFVLCPGHEYDRSPCGTGTSAKLAVLADRGTLAPGETYIQESILGTRFTARYQRLADSTILPEITGTAYVTAQSSLLRDPEDVFPFGIGG